MQQVVLTNFLIKRPKNEIKQEVIQDWMLKSYEQVFKAKNKIKGGNQADPALINSLGDSVSEESPEAIEKKYLRLGVSPSKISKRGFFVDDFGHQNWSQMEYFNYSALPAGPSYPARMKAYQIAADQIFDAYYADSLEQAPESIVHVSCTGYQSPSCAQKRVVENKWTQTTAVIHAYHMGCYAAIPAIKIARDTLKKGRVDIVHTELCSLHFDAATTSSEQIVVKTLFADGAIKYSAVPFETFDSKAHNGLAILTSREEMIPNGLGDMTWKLGDNNLEMTLSREVPEKIGRHLKPYLERLFQDAGLDYERDAAQCVFAIHPGGPKIIDQIQELLGLENEQLKASRSILYQYGNMSSATLPHIFTEVLNDNAITKGTVVVGLAFGPGLTMAGGVFRKV